MLHNSTQTKVQQIKRCYIDWCHKRAFTTVSQQFSFNLFVTSYQGWDIFPSNDCINRTSHSIHKCFTKSAVCSSLWAFTLSCNTLLLGLRLKGDKDQAGAEKTGNLLMAGFLTESCIFWGHELLKCISQWPFWATPVCHTASGEMLANAKRLTHLCIYCFHQVTNS